MVRIFRGNIRNVPIEYSINVKRIFRAMGVNKFIYYQIFNGRWIQEINSFSKNRSGFCIHTRSIK